jgi:serine/threonine-protein kinase HipA
MMQQELSVFLNREQTGKLTFNGPDDRYGFEYSQSWLKKKGFIISPHIRPQKNDSDTIKRFLSNLLPEGKWLEELSINNQISKSNIFGLIALIGTETTGAL